MNTLALYSDPTVSVEMSRVTRRSKQTEGEATFLRFEGNVHPTLFRGEGLRRTIPLTAGFFRTERAQAVALDALLEQAFNAADPRLLLTTDSEFFGVDEVVVAVPAWSEAHEVGGVTTVDFTATRVEP